MMEKERYETILEVLAEKVKEQASMIGYLMTQNTELENKIAEAEASANMKAEKEI
jgi:hypothetical protein